MLFNTGIARRLEPAQRQRDRTTQARADSRPGRMTQLLGRRERGTALIFALVMLLLLTILGITAVTTSSLQEKMAGNMRDQYMAQQAGDSILFDGQALVFNQQTKPIPSCPPDPAMRIWDSSCLPAAVASFVSAPAGPNWWLTATDNWWTSVGFLSGVANTRTAQEPRFVVERIQRAPLNAEIGHKKKVEKFYFRTTGWSVGATDYSGGLVQGVFSKRSDTYVNP
jgi:type IV pilus assembly protein PilX